MRATSYITILILSISFASQASAQKLYVNIHYGYGLSAAPNYLHAVDSYDSTINTGSIKYIKGSGSLGAGSQFGATIGYVFSANISAELGIGYLSGKSIFDDYWKFVSNDNYKTKGSSLSGSMFRINPSIKISCGTKKISPYLKTGIILGIASRITSYSKTVDVHPLITEVEEQETKFSGRMTLGFSFGAGAQYSVNDKIGIFTEVLVITQSWAPKKAELTKYTIYGLDQLPDMTTYEKEKEFVSSYSETTQNVDKTEPEKQLKVFFPFSSVGLNAGISYKL